MDAVSEMNGKTHVISKNEEAETLLREIRQNIRESRIINKKLRRKYGLSHRR